MDSFLREKRKKNAILKAKAIGVRRRCCKEWEILTDDQKVQTRSLRAKKGIKCEECGNVGYYTEICPNMCFKEVEKDTVAVGLSRFDDEEEVHGAATQVSTGSGDGFLWYKDQNGSDDGADRGEMQRGSKKADLRPLKDNMRLEADRLREDDAQLSDYVFYRDASEGYARDMSELTLHQALRRLMRVLEREIELNIMSLEAKDDLTLFHPPARKLGEDFYPEEIGKIKEYREYFTQQKVKKDRMYQAYQHKGSLRTDGALDDMYRNPKAIGMQCLYDSDKNAGQSMHSKIGWKDVMSTGDDLAIADPAMAAKVANVDKMLRKQGAWTAKQKLAFVQTNERFLHMWHIIKEEIHKEHDREYRLLSVDVHSNLERTEKDVWRERIDSADRIMATISGYGLSNGTNDADYITFCIQKWKDELIASKQRRQKRIEAGTLDKSDVAATNAKKKRLEKKKRIGNRKRVGGRVVKSIVATRINSPEEEVGMGDDNDYDKDDDDSTSVSQHSSVSGTLVSSLDSVERLAALNTAMTLKSSTKGGFQGLGLLSTFGMDETKHHKEKRSSAAVTAQLLLGGPSSIFGDELLKAEMSSSSTGDDASGNASRSGAVNVGGALSSPSKSSSALAGHRAGSVVDGRSWKSSKLTLKRKPFVDHRTVDNRKMKELSTTYENVGMKRNIRTGANTDLSTLTPALIPFHDVITNLCAPEDKVQSYAGYNAVYNARMKLVNPNTGYVPKSYVPLYVRTTLFEANGTSESGDQTYANMAKDRRYSAQLGRAMASLEPVQRKQMKDKGNGQAKKDSEGDKTQSSGAKLRIK